MKIVVDGTTFDHDPGLFMAREARLVQRATGMTPDAFNKGLEKDDPEAVTALVWILRRRAGEADLEFDDVDFNLAGIQFLADEPDPTQADPASSGSASVVSLSA